jgi:hypothetical protein
MYIDIILWKILVILIIFHHSRNYFLVTCLLAMNGINNLLVKLLCSEVMASWIKLIPNTIWVKVICTQDTINPVDMLHWVWIMNYRLSFTIHNYCHCGCCHSHYYHHHQHHILSVEFFPRFDTGKWYHFFPLHDESIEITLYWNRKCDFYIKRNT